VGFLIKVCFASGIVISYKEYMQIKFKGELARGEGILFWGVIFYAYR
jgi:hypothetical protein